MEAASTVVSPACPPQPSSHERSTWQGCSPMSITSDEVQCPIASAISVYVHCVVISIHWCMRT